MFKLFNLKWKKEFEEQKTLYEIEIKKREAQIEILESRARSDRDILSRKLQSEYEIKQNESLSLLKLDYQQQIKQKEIDLQREINVLKAKVVMDQADWKEKLQEENYTRLKDAMTKLHEEGNITTKFTQDIALKMLEKVPAARTEHKFLQGDISINSDDK